jgi:hypothetical protein
VRGADADGAEQPGVDDQRRREQRPDAGGPEPVHVADSAQVVDGDRLLDRRLTSREALRGHERRPRAVRREPARGAPLEPAAAVEQVDHGQVRGEHLDARGDRLVQQLVEPARRGGDVRQRLEPRQQRRAAARRVVGRA